MAGAFESFVQSELPLRPFTNSDGNAESIAIRRGLGPRQMTFLDLEDNQVLARVGGVLKGISINVSEGGNGAGGVRHYIADVGAGNEQSTWTLNHNLGSKNMVYTVYELNATKLRAIIPDSVEIIDTNTVELKFSAPIAGKAILSFVD